MTKVTVAATQTVCTWNINDNLDNAEKLVRKATEKGAQIILLQELFETPYFCVEHDPSSSEIATTVDTNIAIKRFSTLARELKVALPNSWYERANNALFNSVAMIDADGSVMGVYRKTHIPEYIGYHEKFYFSPGDTGFKVRDTAYAKIGVGICWDQWFPEAARCMALQGAELLFYPTAIGSEPSGSGIASMPHWQNTMCGHAAANLVGVIASNRIGTEQAKSIDRSTTFYGSSFIADRSGQKVAEANRETETILTHTFNLADMREYRQDWGVFRDRHPDTYHALLTYDGVSYQSKDKNAI